MKNIKYIFLFILGLSVLYACKKPDSEPVLDNSNIVKPAISSPDNGGVYVLLKAEADSVFAKFEWSETVYNLSNLETIKYTLQMDIADSNFMNITSLGTTSELTLSPTVSQINDKALAKGVAAGEARDFSFRVLSYINNETTYSDAYSDVITLMITPYEDVVQTKAIYLLGSGTTVGWDNVNALMMTELEGGTYAIVDHLTPGADAYIKFISVPGQWAPQWGTDASGLPEAGPLIYRPDETVADPDAIPVGDVEGNYYIVADTVGLTYTTILTSGELFLVGGGTTVGWDAAAAIPFTQDPDTLTKFSIVTSLLAEGGMKFLEIQGEWVPQWGSYDGGISGGTLSYRENETAADPPEIPVPGTAGEYLIIVDLGKMKYTFTPQ